MKLTKYQHACFTLEKDGEILVVDPGSDTHDFTPGSNIAGVLITHEHSDHLSHDLVRRILEQNPAAILVGPEHTFEDYPGSNIITTDTELTIGKFDVKIYVGRHDMVHPDFPTVPMLRYFIDNAVYYGGDTVSAPDIHPTVMAVPVAANWFRFGEVIDLVRRLQPTYAFPTHDRLLSDIGKRQADTHMTNLTRSHNIQYTRLDSTTPLEFEVRE